MGGHEARPFVDERGAQVSRDEVRVVEHCLEEGNVGRDTSDAELRKTAASASDRSREIAAPTGHLDQHRVEVRTDLGTGVDSPAIQTDAAAARRTIGGDLSRVGTKPRSRILCGDAALQGGPPQGEVMLLQAELLEGLPERDAHLRLHQVDIRHLLSHRVLHLNARVHLDEDVLPGALPRGVEQEFDSARVDVTDRLRKGDRVTVHGVTDVVVEIRCRRDLHDFLMPTLHRTIALEQVHGLTRGVGENLNFDVTRSHHGLLDEHGRVSERAVRFAHRFLESTAEVVLPVDPAHPATTPACDCFGEHREPDLVGPRDECLHVGRRGRRIEHGHAGTHGMLLRGHLVAGHLEHALPGPDEGDSRVCRSSREFGVL